jgi:hypothetical protein
MASSVPSTDCVAETSATCPSSNSIDRPASDAWIAAWADLAGGSASETSPA